MTLWYTSVLTLKPRPPQVLVDDLIDDIIVVGVVPPLVRLPQGAKLIYVPSCGNVNNNQKTS